MGFFNDIKKAVHNATAPEHHGPNHRSQKNMHHGPSHHDRGERDHHGPNGRHYPPGYNPAYEYYAVVDKSALFWSGEMPDINFGSARLCKSYDEMMNELTKKLNEAFEKAMKWNDRLPQKTSYEELQMKNPGKQIVAVYPTIRF